MRFLKNYVVNVLCHPNKGSWQELENYVFNKIKSCHVYKSNQPVTNTLVIVLFIYHLMKLVDQHEDEYLFIRMLLLFSTPGCLDYYYKFSPIVCKKITFETNIFGPGKCPKIIKIPKIENILLFFARLLSLIKSNEMKVKPC